jgi:hypothetical protein
LKLTWIAMAMATTLGPNALAGGEDNSRESTALRVQIYDYADLDAAVLGRFLSLAQKNLASTGMSVQVRLCRGNGALSCDSVSAESAQSPVVRIIAGGAKTMKDARLEPLGQSFADHDGGTVASVFVAPTRDQAAGANMAWITILSYAAAHEVGHLLLGNRAHTSRGVMKASWDLGDYTAMDQNQCHFTKEQSEILASRYGNTGR